MTTTKEIIRTIVNKHEEEEEGYLSKSLAVLSHRPFNMKGQEIEEIIGLLIYNGLQTYYKIIQPSVSVPQNKDKADIIFKFEESNRKLAIKSYGGAKRFQLSTLSKILPNIRNEFQDVNSGELDPLKKNWLINQINSVEVDYTLSFFFFNNAGEIKIHCFDFESLSIESFKDNNFQLIKKANEQRPEIYIPISGNITLEISAGSNAYNRGMWINNVTTEDDLNVIYNTSFIQNIFTVSRMPNEFDKDKYIFDKAKATIELIRKYFI
jgi:hypothetical protein